MGVNKGDTRSFDYSSDRFISFRAQSFAGRRSWEPGSEPLGAQRRSQTLHGKGAFSKTSLYPDPPM